MIEYQYDALQAIRKIEQEHDDNLRGSMENSGQEKGLRVSTEKCMHGVPMADICQPCVDLSMDYGYSPSLRTRYHELSDAIKDATNAALEKAAKVCEDLAMFNYDDPGESYARVIRALKT